MPFRRVILICSLFLIAFLPFGSADAAITVDKDYTILSPEIGTDTPDKIEVAEFFWYHCPHCFNLEPALNAWIKKAPKDVAIRRIPAVLNASWVPLAKTYYAMEALGVVNKYHDDLFNAIHLEGLDTSQESNIFNWAGMIGMNKQAFINAYQSFGVQSKVMRAYQLTRDAKITGVPTFIVDGKYSTSESMTGSEAALFSTLDQLIAKARKERAAKAARRK
ncbi:MAG TPA: thiol:disulfide interchange protein DsbA/DsbL [Burkholderiales bacterium]|nr:thiol:disulfide interchange protein DsbA/DsbL [Burkholderiales bacterium]